MQTSARSRLLREPKRPKVAPPPLRQVKYPYKIDKYFQQRIHPLDPQERALLEASILKEGIKQKLVVWKETNILLDGHHRHFIWLRNPKVAAPQIEYRSFPTRDHAELWVIENQAGRRNVDREMLYVLFADAAAINYKLEMLAAGKKIKPNQDIDYLADDAEEIALREQEGYIGKQLQLNKSLHKRGMRMAWELRRDAPKVFEKIRTNETTLKLAYKDWTNEKNQKQLEKTAQIKVDPVKGLFDVIITDPPWPVPGMISGVDSSFQTRGKPKPYPTMSLDAIEAELSGVLRKNAAKNCMVFIWTTQTYLRDALKMCELWEDEFKYGCLFVWKKNAGMQPFGLPTYNAEFIIFLRKGKTQFTTTKNFAVCFEAKRGEGHSAKPEEFYEMIRTHTSGRRLDMYNRRKIDGFTLWGNEAATQSRILAFQHKHRRSADA